MKKGLVSLVLIVIMVFSFSVVVFAPCEDDEPGGLGPFRHSFEIPE